MVQEVDETLNVRVPEGVDFGVGVEVGFELCLREGECLCDADEELEVKLVTTGSGERGDIRSAILPVRALINDTVPSAQATARIWPVTMYQKVAFSLHIHCLERKRRRRCCLKVAHFDHCNEGEYSPSLLHPTAVTIRFSPSCLRWSSSSSSSAEKFAPKTRCPFNLHTSTDPLAVTVATRSIVGQYANMEGRQGSASERAAIWCMTVDWLKAVLTVRGTVEKQETSPRQLRPIEEVLLASEPRAYTTFGVIQQSPRQQGDGMSRVPRRVAVRGDLIPETSLDGEQATIMDKIIRSYSQQRRAVTHESAFLVDAGTKQVQKIVLTTDELQVCSQKPSPISGKI